MVRRISARHLGQGPQQFGRQYADVLVVAGAGTAAVFGSGAAVGAQGDLAAEPGEAVEGVGVADAAEDDFDAGGVPDGLCSGVVPAGFELGEAVADRDDEDAFAGAVGHP